MARNSPIIKPLLDGFSSSPSRFQKPQSKWWKGTPRRQYGPLPVVCFCSLSRGAFLVQFIDSAGSILNIFWLSSFWVRILPTPVNRLCVIGIVTWSFCEATVDVGAQGSLVSGVARNKQPHDKQGWFYCPGHFRGLLHLWEIAPGSFFWKLSVQAGRKPGRSRHEK